jgi:hypothetical protein
MNKLKNIGISALAGTLVSLSAAQAGGVTVGGTWELSYTNLNHEKASGNKIGMNKNISFSASGDVSDGGGVTWATTIGGTDALGLSSASMNINMGGIATLAYDSGTGGYGANAVDNIVPTAWEEIDYGLSTGITDVGVVSKSKGVVNLTIKAPVAGTGISLSYVSSISAGHVADGATSGIDSAGGRGIDAVLDLVNYDSAHFGFRLGMAAEMEVVEMSCKKRRNSLEGPQDCNAGHKNNPYGGTAYTTLKLGPIHLGTQATFKDPQDPTASGIANKRAIVAGAAVVIGDTLSFSYGQAWDKYRYNDADRNSQPLDEGASGGVQVGGEYQTIRYNGWSAALNFGPVAIKGTKNNVSGMGEAGNSAPRSHSEINLSIAF